MLEQNLVYAAEQVLRLWGTIIAFGMCGVTPVKLLRSNLRFFVLVAPFTGLLLVNLAALSAYFILKVPFSVATLFAFGLGFSAFLAGCFWKRAKAVTSLSDQLLWPLVTMALISVLYLILSDGASLWTGSPAVMYFDGTGHMGYANVAQWLSEHLGLPSIGVPGYDNPHADPYLPYESMPNIMLNSEPRNGVFGLLTLAAFIFKVPAAYAYDKTCAVVLTCALPGVAALFSKKWPIFLLLLLGLIISSLYDFSHAGYLGKTVAYPAVLLWFGLYIHSRVEPGTDATFVLALLAAASSVMLSGIVIGAAIFILGVSFLLLGFAISHNWDRNSFFEVSISAFVAVAAGGFLIHPVNGWAFGNTFFEFVIAGSRALDLDGWVTGPGFNVAVGATILVGAIAIPMALGFVGLCVGQPAAAALLFAASAIFLGLSFFTSRTELVQTTGLLYPAMLCGSALLFSNLQARAQRYALFVVAGMVVMI